MSEQIKKKLRMVNLACAAVIVGGIAVPASFGIVKLYAHGRQRIKDASDLNSQNTTLDLLNATLLQKDADRQQSETRLSAFEKRLPSSNEMDLFMQQLAKVASDAGLQIDSTMPGKNLVDVGAYKAAQVDITGVGDWNTCYKFLTGLKSMDRLTRLDSLTLESVNTRSADGQEQSAFLSNKPNCRITLRISTFMAR